jgi:hypothetical protein
MGVVHRWFEYLVYYVKLLVFYAMSDWLTTLYIVLSIANWAVPSFASFKLDHNIITTMYASAKTSDLVKHGINSKWNSDTGIPPEFISKPEPVKPCTKLDEKK